MWMPGLVNLVLQHLSSKYLRTDKSCLLTIICLPKTGIFTIDPVCSEFVFLAVLLPCPRTR